MVAWLDERGRIDDADEPPFYSRMLDAWERAGKNAVAEFSNSSKA